MKLFTLIVLVLNMLLKKPKDLLDIKTIRIQADNSIMCVYFFLGFIDFILANKTLIDFTSLLSLYDFKKNDDRILSYFK